MQQIHLTWVGPAEATEALLQLLRSTWRELGLSTPVRLPTNLPALPALLLGLLLMAAILGLTSSTYRRGLSQPAAATAGILFAAFAYAMLVAAHPEARQAGYPFRYLLPSALLLQTALITWTLSPLAAALPAAWARRSTDAWATLGLGLPLGLGACLLAFGPPSLAQVQADLDRLAGGLTADLLAQECTHLAGDYWTVWPSVLHANMAHYARGDNRTLWGISHRGAVTQPRWAAMPRASLRICVPHGDPQAGLWLHQQGLGRLRPVARARTLMVLRPAD